MRIILGLLLISSVSCPNPTPTPVPPTTTTTLPSITCANKDCAEGYTCQMIDNLPQCILIPVPTTSCPKPLADGAYVYVDAKKYGNGIDTETRVYGDPEFCQMIHGVPAKSCHLEGWPQRQECELELLGGCPIFQWSINGSPYVLCQQAQNIASCDHFGNTTIRDDPNTPTRGNTLATLTGFEGEPKVCGLQRDSISDPQAGFFTIAHGEGQIRACKPDGTGCGKIVNFAH